MLSLKKTIIIPSQNYSGRHQRCDNLRIECSLVSQTGLELSRSTRLDWRLFEVVGDDGGGEVGEEVVARQCNAHHSPIHLSSTDLCRTKEQISVLP